MECPKCASDNITMEEFDTLSFEDAIDISFGCSDCGAIYGARIHVDNFDHLGG